MAVKTILILVHLFGLVLGLGAATVADLLFVRSLMRNRITRDQFAMLKHVTDLVVIGLIVLGISGFGFLLVYLNSDPHLMMNPKLWAKVGIVGVLTANGFLMHDFILPLLERNLERPLFSVPEIKKSTRILFGCGAISFTSWMSALLLGVWKEANFKYTYLEIFGGYGAVLTLAVLTSPLLCVAIVKIAERVSPAFVQEVESATTVWHVEDRRQEPRGESYALLRKEIRRASRQRDSVSLLAFDLPSTHFEMSEVAAEILEKEITGALFGLLRSPDHLMIVGKGKYLCILPSTGESDLAQAIRRISNGLSSMEFDMARITGHSDAAPLRLTFTVRSVTSFPTEKTEPEQILAELNNIGNRTECSRDSKLELVA